MRHDTLTPPPQIPVSITEDELRGLFAPYGTILDLALLKKNAPGLSCAFVTYERWSQCEAAILAHSGKTVLEGAKAPMVVKFADAAGGAAAGAPVAGSGSVAAATKRPFNNDGGGSVGGMGGYSNKKQFNGGMMPGAGYMGYNMGMPFDMSGMAMVRLGHSRIKHGE